MKKSCFMISLVILVLILCACKLTTGTEASTGISEEPPAADSRTATFDNYEDYFAFFEKGSNSKLADIVADPEAYARYFGTVEDPELANALGDWENYGPTIMEYVHRVASGEKLIVPYLDGSPLTKKDGLSGITIMGKELYGWLHTWFFTEIDGTRVIIRVADIPEEYRELAKTETAASFIAQISPSAPNLHNLQEAKNYTSIYEEDLCISGQTITALVLNAADGTTYYKFLLNGSFLCIFAPSGVVTTNWLSRLSFTEITIQAS